MNTLVEALATALRSLTWSGTERGYRVEWGTSWASIANAETDRLFVDALLATDAMQAWLRDNDAALVALADRVCAMCRYPEGAFTHTMHAFYPPESSDIYAAAIAAARERLRGIY